MSKEILDLNDLIDLRAKFGDQKLLGLIKGDYDIVPKISQTPKWREENGVIYFSVTSDGTAGEEWISRLEGKGFKVGKYSKQLLVSKDFKPTTGITTQIAIMKGELFKDEDRITRIIRAEAEKRNLQKPNAEVACLIREYLTDDDIKAMDLYWIIVMHEPINDFGGDPRLLNVSRYVGVDWLSSYCDFPGLRWRRESGFASAVSQVSS